MQNSWEQILSQYLLKLESACEDASHDLGHFKRVANYTKMFAKTEDGNADVDILTAAAYLHDIVNLPKNHPEAKLASLYSAKKARDILHELCFPNDKIDAVCHAIHAHSFSANITPETLEAKILQDADRMESVGALGAIRTFYVSGRLNILPYNADDLFAKHRPLNDKAFGFDHFFCKLYKLPGLMQTASGKTLAAKRNEFLDRFSEDLSNNLSNGNGAQFISWTCYYAGKNGGGLFKMEDPLALNRPLDLSYVADYIIKHREKYAFLSVFLNQLKDEVSIDTGINTYRQ